MHFLIYSLMKVLKFGGSSVGTPESIRRVKKIIKKQPLPCIVVVSAFQEVTDDLLLSATLASGKQREYLELAEKIILKHRDFAETLIDNTTERRTLFNSVNVLSEDLNKKLEMIFKSGMLHKELLDQVLSFGERLSSLIISSFIPGSLLFDSREFIITGNNLQVPEVDFNLTNSLIEKKFRNCNQLVIVPGFIAATTEGKTITLGRGGSDYTAAIIAAALKAEILEIWTDVDGFMTADPKKVERAYTIDNLTYAEAMELSHFGAKVIYTPTLRPVYKEKVPVIVRNTFNPESEGTIISNRSENGSPSPIKGISSIDHIDLITLQGPAMVGVTGTSARLFSALARQNINIILITQASSEFSISFAIKPTDSTAATDAIGLEFVREIDLNKELKITVERNLSIIAIVGERMKNTPGISAILFRALGRNGINVIATAQGSSELNISVVVKNESLKKALNVIHDGFFLSRYKEINLFVAGTGLVGSSLIKQLNKQAGILFDNHKIKINLIGITNSRKMLIDKKGIPLESCREIMKNEGEKAIFTDFVQKIKKLNLRNAAFIDCTADGKVASEYGEILSGYISVITANKIACSSGQEYYRKLKNIAGERGVRFMYETTVGAGLPIIRTINDLVLSGDRVLKIEAVLSGTLNFIFNELSREMPLSIAIRKAREKGYSEPDPRVDLSGTDVARKILILGREAGYNIEYEDVKIISFLPSECFTGDLNDFYRCVEKYDSEFENNRIELLKKNKKWRYIATFEEGKAIIELKSVNAEHPTYYLEGSNNIVLLTTERYRELPMVIKGYGAGADVTAAGVFADLMRVVNV
jgi:aspartokinase/homoserine dehydrogenase 1